LEPYLERSLQRKSGSRGGQGIYLKIGFSS
jgi:hypothetical protein